MANARSQDKIGLRQDISQNFDCFVQVPNLDLLRQMPFKKIQVQIKIWLEQFYITFGWFTYLIALSGSSHGTCRFIAVPLLVYQQSTCLKNDDMIHTIE